MTKPKNKLRLSASQIDTYSSCALKWWFGKVARLPVPSDPKLVLGEVGHGVAENFLQDKPLYPEGWTAPINRFNGKRSEYSITTTEQALVKALIKKAVDEGVLIRHPDQIIEHEFRAKHGTVEGVDISLIGFIDHYYGNHIDDHKFIGERSGRYYSTSKLDTAIAMNLYAWAAYEEGLIKESSVWLRYNLFFKSVSKPAVKEVSFEKTKEDIYKYYEEEIVPKYRDMALTYKNCTEWHQVDSAMRAGCAKTTCQKYGGCEFLDICLGKVSPDQYRERFNTASVKDKRSGQQNVLDDLLNNKTTTKENRMPGFLSNLKKEVPAASAEASTEVPAAEAPTKPEPATEAPVQSSPAPWAFHACPVCKDSAQPGIHEGQPCNICVLSTNSEKEKNPAQPVLADFDVVVADNGTVTWESKDKTPVVETKVVEEEVEVKEQVVSLAGESFEEEVPVATGEEEPIASRQEEIPEVTGPIFGALDPKEINLERTGMLLSYAPIRQRKRVSRKVGDSNCIVTMQEVMEYICGTLLNLANMNGAAAKSWYDIDTWPRRDLLRNNAKEIAEVIGNSMVDASSVCKGSDEEVLCSAVERYAVLICGSMD